MGKKECSKCNIHKEINEFVKDKRYEDGTRSYCKECNNSSRRKTPLKQKAKSGNKFCAKCLKELKLEEFNTRNVKGVKKHFSYCKCCERDYDKSRYEKKCSNCGIVYKSGRKNSVKCKSCHSKFFSEIGKAKLEIKNKNQSGEKNHMFGVKRVGAENPNYKHSKTDKEREEGRLLEGYKDWREGVYQRDNYTCTLCNDNSGGNLNAHHLNGYDWFKEGRLEIDNGITLCKYCHRNFHKEFGYGKNTKEQFLEFKTTYNKLIPR